MVVKKQLIASDMLSALGTSLTDRSRKELELLVEKPLEHSDSCRATVSRPGKGLRTGGNRREVSKAIFAGIPEGTYEVSYTNNYDTKKYTVKVISWGVQVWRTA